MPKKIEISHKTIIFTVLFLILLALLYFIRDIILQFFVALLVMTILNPLVVKLSKFKIPRAVSILVVYILTLGTIGVVLAGIIPPLVDQTTTFVNNLPGYIDNLAIPNTVVEPVVSQLFSTLGELPAQAAKATISIFSNIFNVILVLIFAFYLLMSRSKQDEQLVILFGKERSKKIAKTIDMLEFKLGGWARGQLFLMFLIGLITYIGLRLLGIPYALPLSILAGFFELIPIVGPLVAAIPTVIIGFSISPLIGIATTALVFLIQQLENYLIVPKIMGKSVGVNPIVILLALAIGFRIAGATGALISVPVFITAQVFVKVYIDSK